jgi:AraC-like DNA-binding protein
VPHVHRIFESAIVGITDYRCDERVGGSGPEEASRGWDVVFVRTGLFVRHVGRRRVVCDANHVLFFNRDEPYRVSHPVHGGDDCTVVSVTSAFLRDTTGGARFGATHVHSAAEVDLLHRRLYDAIRHGPSERLAVEEIALALVRQALRSAAPAPVDATRARHRDIAEHAKEILAARFAEDLTLDRLANLVGCSPFHLARIFRREVGRSIHQYRLALRVRTALARIAGGERNLSALAFELGFVDQAHFSNTFRRAVGFPPSRGRTRTSIEALVEASKKLQA